MWRYEGSGHSITYVEEKRGDKLFEGFYIFGDSGLKGVDHNIKNAEVKKVETQGKSPEPRTGHASCFNYILRLYCICGGRDSKQIYSDFIVLNVVNLNWVTIIKSGDPLV